MATTLKKLIDEQSWELAETQVTSMKQVIDWYNANKKYPLSSEEMIALKEAFLDQGLIDELTEEEVAHLADQGIEPASFSAPVWVSYFKELSRDERLQMKSQTTLGDLTMGDYTHFMIESGA